MPYIAMNQFKVISGKETEFEASWRNRVSYLDDVEGFRSFQLLKGDEGVYISHSTWESHDLFTAWTKSEAFRAAHRDSKVGPLIEGHPVFRGYDVVL